MYVLWFIIWLVLSLLTAWVWGIGNKDGKGFSVWLLVILALGLVTLQTQHFQSVYDSSHAQLISNAKHVAEGQFYECKLDKTVKSFVIEVSSKKVVITNTDDTHTTLNMATDPAQQLQVGAKYCSDPTWGWYAPPTTQ